MSGELQHADVVGRSEAIEPSHAVSFRMGEQQLDEPGTHSSRLPFVGDCHRELAEGGISGITCNADNRLGGALADNGDQGLLPSVIHADQAIQQLGGGLVGEAYYAGCGAEVFYEATLALRVVGPDRPDLVPDTLACLAVVDPLREDVSRQSLLCNCPGVYSLRC